VVAGEGWHPGVIGIVASRLVEKYYRPAIVIALDAGRGKGSGRSVRGFDLYQALASCKDLFEDFGGHPQAAGLTVEARHVDELRKRINQHAAENYGAEIFVKKLEADMELGLEDLRPVFLKELDQMEPFGLRNPRPVFLTRGLKLKSKPSYHASRTARFHVTDGALVFEASYYENPLVGNRFSEMLAGSAQPFEMIYSVKTKSVEGEDRVILEAKEVRPLL